MKVRKSKLLRSSGGQSLLETALMIPLMLCVVLNAVNLGYFFFVIVNLVSTTRIGGEYSIMGPNSPGTTAYPPATNSNISVASLLYNELTGAVWNPTNTTVQICSPAIIGSNGTGTTAGYANCVTCTSSSSCGSAVNGSSSTTNLDPESATAGFVTNRVTVQYSFPPLIGGSPFNLILMSNLYNSSTGQYTFYRHIEMRAM